MIGWAFDLGEPPNSLKGSPLQPAMADDTFFIEVNTSKEVDVSSTDRTDIILEWNYKKRRLFISTLPIQNAGSVPISTMNCLASFP